MSIYGFLHRSALKQLPECLNEAGYRCIGPRVREGAVTFGELTSIDDLPRGVGDEQRPAHYRLGEREDERLFAWAVGPQGLKSWLFTPRETLWRSRRDDDGRLYFETGSPADDRPLAAIGVRACDLAALRLQDAHFLEREPDPGYRKRRAGLFLVAVDCTHPAETCFCHSTGDGPACESGFDLALHELDDGFIVHAGSEAGERVAARLPLLPVGEEQEAARRDQQRAAIDAQQRALPGRNLRDALFANLDHERWQAVAERCLSCANCTSVCPTCFCHSHEEVPDLDGRTSEHLRQWDSCFTEGHSYIHGIVIRAETPERYRQWLTHKLGSWHDQYGRSGCVGCGRCITWCPVGIDLTEEATVICAEAGDD